MDAGPSNSRGPAQKARKPKWTREQKQARDAAKAAAQNHTTGSRSLSQRESRQRIHQEMGGQNGQFAGLASSHDQVRHAGWPQSQQGYGGFAQHQTFQIPMHPFQQQMPTGGLQSNHWNQFNQFAQPMQQFHTSQPLNGLQADQWAIPQQPPRSPARPAGRDAIVPPSAASGGVPDPTPAYLAQALIPSIRLPAAKALLLVIDLNGTLLFRPDGRAPKSFEARPHAAEFLKYVTKTFWVVIWSSAREENVAAMIKKLLPSYTTFDAHSAPAGAATGQNPSDASDGCALVAAWSRNHFGLSSEDYNKRVQCYKRLSALWNTEAIAKTHPGYNATETGIKTRWDQSNTVLIDDSSEKARSEPHNLIQIEEFNGSVGGREDDMLPQVHDYINELCFQSDVSSYMRANPFRPSEGGWHPKAESPGRY